MRRFRFQALASSLIRFSLLSSSELPSQPSNLNSSISLFQALRSCSGQEDDMKLVKELVVKKSLNTVYRELNHVCKLDKVNPCKFSLILIFHRYPSYHICLNT